MITTSRSPAAHLSVSVIGLTAAMKLRPWAISFAVCSLFLAGASLLAQSPAQKEQISKASIANVQRAVDKAAAARNMVLTDAAKRELAMEAVRQEAAPGKTAEREESPEAKVDQLFKSIEPGKPGVQVDAEQVKQVVVADKSSQIRTTLAQVVDAQAATAGLTLPDDVRGMLVSDLEKQTAGLAASGLPVDVIQEKNQNFFRGIVQNLHGAPITGTSYGVAQQAIFQRFVNLRIESVPSGAAVKMNNIELGVTDIPSRPLEPGKMYQFEFALAGYKTAQRPFFVAAGENTELLREPLIPDPAVPEANKREDGSAQPVGKPAFPWIYVLIGLAVLGALLFLAKRK